MGEGIPRRIWKQNDRITSEAFSKIVIWFGDKQGNSLWTKTDGTALTEPLR